MDRLKKKVRNNKKNVDRKTKIHNAKEKLKQDTLLHSRHYKPYSGTPTTTTTTPALQASLRACGEPGFFGWGQMYK